VKVKAEKVFNTSACPASVVCKYIFLSFGYWQKYFLLLLLMYLFSYIIYSFVPANFSGKASKYLQKTMLKQLYVYRWKKGTEEQKADILSFKTSIYQPPTQEAWFSEENIWAPGLPFVTITVKNWRGLTCTSSDGIEFRSSGPCKPPTAGASALQLLSRDDPWQDSSVGQAGNNLFSPSSFPQQEPYPW